MPVELEAIAFNHDPTSARTSAFNVRLDRTTDAPVPEWRRGETFVASGSRAAYSVAATAGRRVTVQASFRALGASAPGLVEVRALDESPDGPGVLGAVRARTLALPPQGGVTVELFETTADLSRSGVGASDVSWRWQSRRQPGDAWADLAVTHHRIYVVLAVPTLPWLQITDRETLTQLPWLDVLEHACRWALGARTEREAAGAITRRVFELGLRYNCPGGGATQYAWSAFNCTAFLDLLAGGPGSGGFINCTDCATIVSTFANSVGCDLWQSRMGMIAPFSLNEILAIGWPDWQTACGLGAFFYHEVAWTGDCGDEDELYDACLAVDGDGDPTRAPHRPLLAAPLPFGAPGTGGYRDLLSRPDARALCQAQPSTRVRRPVF